MISKIKKLLKFLFFIYVLFQIIVGIVFFADLLGDPTYQYGFEETNIWFTLAIAVTLVMYFQVEKYEFNRNYELSFFSKMIVFGSLTLFFLYFALLTITHVFFLSFLLPMMINAWGGINSTQKMTFQDIWETKPNIDGYVSPHGRTGNYRIAAQLVGFGLLISNILLVFFDNVVSFLNVVIDFIQLPSITVNSDAIKAAGTLLFGIMSIIANGLLTIKMGKSMRSSKSIPRKVLKFFFLIGIWIFLIILTILVPIVTSVVDNIFSTNIAEIVGNMCLFSWSISYIIGAIFI